ncbi:MAG: low affinity iron permease family protein [Proteobacteria bacterium]|nr:low affinity iron permease family protein [Pseudomonadota bacterium]
MSHSIERFRRGPTALGGNSQNIVGKAIQLKLDERIRSTQSARDFLIDLEYATEDEIENLQKEFAKRRRC